mmetsp:Transcript_17022/g.48636  ORF Transcript_17022/g.48636 Transcript_17022/m.48636 type:complete len:325 (+) Transcript_17022:919-1893(+)
MRGIQVDGDPRRLLRQLLRGVPQPLSVGAARRGASAALALPVRHEVRHRARLQDDDYGHRALVSLQDLHERVDIILPVLPQGPLAASGLRVQVAGAVGGPRAAELAPGRLRAAVSVGQVVHDERHQLSRNLPRGVLQYTLQARRATSADHRLPVDPDCRGHIPHGFQPLAHYAGAARNGAGKLGLLQRALVEEIEGIRVHGLLLRLHGVPRPAQAHRPDTLPGQLRRVPRQAPQARRGHYTHDDCSHQGKTSHAPMLHPSLAAQKPAGVPEAPVGVEAKGGPELIVVLVVVVVDAGLGEGRLLHHDVGCQGACRPAAPRGIHCR